MTTADSSSSSSSEDEQPQQQNLTKKQLQELSRRKLKNKKKKLSKRRKARGDEDEEDEMAESDSAIDSGSATEKASTGGEQIVTDDDLGVEVDYVGMKPELDPTDPAYSYFANVFKNFLITDDIKKEDLEHPLETKKEARKGDSATSKQNASEEILQDEMRKPNEGDEPAVSKRKIRLSLQPSMAKLKESTVRPDVVEWADVTSRDPFLLVALKAYRNTIPVPRHWNAKRKYLAGKRGFERPPFELPDFIKRTGIQEMRENLWEKEDAQSLKSKMRERARPKLGKIDIDYQKLHDAFFKWQSKPMLSVQGELYYEGKELEGRMKDKKPGLLSDELRIALGMPVGHNAHKFPPPWLIAMQRYGPPPSYPTIKIPGLSAPIPEGCAFGYHAGGWGKPPVDQFGKPLYGDVFGVNVEPEEGDDAEDSRMERRHWGEIGSDEDSESEEEEEEEEGEAAAGVDGVATPMTEGFTTPSGITSGIPTGVETPDTIELRKGKRGDESSTGADTPAGPGVAYHVIPEKRVDRIAGQMMASTHVYDLSKKQGMTEHGVEISLNPEDMDLDQRGLEAKYEEQLRKQAKERGEEDDLSDMVAEHSAKQNRKRKAQEQKREKATSGSASSSQSKKYKDFKF